MPQMGAKALSTKGSPAKAGTTGGAQSKAAPAKDGDLYNLSALNA